MCFLRKIVHLFLFLNLTACQTDKEKLQGKRESIIEPYFAQSDPLFLKSVRVQEASFNKSWAQSLQNQETINPFLDIANLKKSWSVEGSGDDSSFILSAPFIDSFVLYFLDSKCFVKAIDAKTGKMLWKKLCGSQKSSNVTGGGVCAVKNNLYITTALGDIFSLQKKDGKVNWKICLNGIIRSQPVSDGRGHIFVMTTGNQTFALNEKDGSVLWKHEGVVEASALLGSSIPLVIQDKIIVTYSSGEVFALSAESGEVLWSDTLSSSSKTESSGIISHIKASPIGKDKIFILSYGGRLVSFNPETGDQLFSKEIGGDATPIASQDWLFVLTSNNDVLCLSKEDGRVRWSLALTKSTEDKEIISWSGLTLASTCLICGNNFGEVIFIDVTTGRIKKKLNTSKAISAIPAVANNSLFILSNDGTLTTFTSSNFHMVQKNDAF
jgi:outer membrane protein assembly factor BamB